MLKDIGKTYCPAYTSALNIDKFVDCQTKKTKKLNFYGSQSRTIHGPDQGQESCRA